MQVTKTHIPLFLLLTAGLLAGCSVINEPEQKKEIAVSTGVTGMKKVRSIDSNRALQDEAIKIDAYFHDTETKYLDGAKLVYDVDQWRFDDGAGNEVHYYWPTEGAVYDPSDANITVSSLDFVGYCPFTKPAYIGTPTYNHATGVSFTCDMSSYMTLASQTTMDEYLIAVSNEQTLATQTANGGVPLEFKHPLAQVKFVFNTASGTHVQINSIGITDAYTGGTCTYDGTTMSWAGTGSDTVKIALASPLKTGGTTETDAVYVIPDTATKYLIVNATWDDWNDVTISDYGTDVAFAWEPGHIYTYNLTIDKYGLKVDTLKFTEQW